MAQYLEMTMNLKTNNQTIKFGQLMGCNMRKIFLKNHTQNVVEKLVPDLFLKNQMLSSFKSYL